jgi:hypothetical protein
MSGPAACRSALVAGDRITSRGLSCGSIGHMTELTDVSGAFGYGDSILAGERVRLRGVRDEDLPTLAKWDMDPGRLATLSHWVAPSSEAAAKERIAQWSANDNPRLPEGRVRRGGPSPRIGAARRPLVRPGADVHSRPRVGGPPIIGPVSEPATQHLAGGG